MRSPTVLFAVVAALFATSSWSFSIQPKLRFQSRVTHLKDISSLSTVLDASEGAKGAIESYVNLFVPLFKQAQDAGLAPDLLIKWGHGSAMATVLFVMGGIGAFLGWQIRLGGGANTYAFTLGKTAREQHPLIMGLAFFFFLLGGQGGNFQIYCRNFLRKWQILIVAYIRLYLVLQVLFYWPSKVNQSWSLRIFSLP